MKRNKIAPTNSNNIWECKNVTITENSNNYYYEIGDNVTMDVSEAVAIMMRLDIEGEIWNTKVDKKDIFNISPKNTLYWMSGGDEEWVLQDNYKKEWHECYLEYQQEFGLKIIGIVERSETLNDIQKEFKKYLSLATLYDFALRRGIA